MSSRLIAITHGRADDPNLCGRPLYVRDQEVSQPDAPIAIAVYVCPVHGDIRDRTGPNRPTEYIHEDRRKRKAYE